MAIHDDNWTQEFSTVDQETETGPDWSTIIPVLIIFAIVAYSAVA